MGTAESLLKMGGDSDVAWPFYNDLKRIIAKSASLLNMGSGTRFHFEAMCRQANQNLIIWSVDKQPMEMVPPFLNKYLSADVETFFELPDAPRFDVVTFFEVLEHVDCTDVLIQNAMRLCRPNGTIVLSFPNLSSLYSRIELLLGFQPHILEVSNIYANPGTGIFGRYNNPTNQPIHHIRGITSRAGRELLRAHGLSVEHLWGASGGSMSGMWKHLPAWAPMNVVVCRNRPEASSDR